jgi:taurine--2-oxoglutarate transaminase
VSDVHDAVSDHDVMIGMGRPGFQLVCSPPFTVGKAEIDRAVDAIADGIETVFE